MEKIALLALGGSIYSQDIKLCGNCSFSCAADSGLDGLLSVGITPNLVIGDMDSVNPKNLSKIKNLGIEIISYPEQKNATDGELAIEELSKRGFGEINIVGLTGGKAGRPDHVLFNYWLFWLENKLGIKLRGFCEGFEIFSVSGCCHIKCKKGMTVSILPFFGTTNMKLSGLKYPFEGKIEPGPARWVSNLALGDFTIESEGKVLVFVQRIPNFFQTLERASTI
ncbi:MAG TPA: thiamine diphosphokinase [Caldisericia bacterium]|nr:thiamine diphosphokinase [Caldisericia bacterium]HPL88978.1 thiamine diphosphokinase [Caldisericia bacterium]HQG59130.1 thiamine diphosphokinase [Caldisericia bacterium]HQH48280.1 thiamine diphosphokinase [Caldisericia bacterium]HQJ44079.1 thiamine diphosphokinase [Caldisericia bacterium]